jgi:hypothetical protein
VIVLAAAPVMASAGRSTSTHPTGKKPNMIVIMADDVDIGAYHRGMMFGKTPGTVENGIFLGLDWLPTLALATGNSKITDPFLRGVNLCGQVYKNHLDGCNQMDLLLGKGSPAHHELFNFAGPALGPIRIDDLKFRFIQLPWGWPGEKFTTDTPSIVNLRQDPFGRTPSDRGESLTDSGGGYLNDFMGREFWRFLMVQSGREAGSDGGGLSPDAGDGVIRSRINETPSRSGD